MIDEKKIEYAAIESSVEDTNKGIVRDGYVISSRVDHELGFQEGFKAGINWFLDNLWHPMSESPELGSEILIEINKETYEGTGTNPRSSIVHEYDYDDWEFYSNDARFSKWLYVDDLLKGGI